MMTTTAGEEESKEATGNDMELLLISNIIELLF